MQCPVGVEVVLLQCGKSTMMRHAVSLIAVLAFYTAACSTQASDDWNWERWRYLPVQHGGRQKPLETLARETFQLVSHRQDLQEPDTREELDPVATYLTMLFEWQGWNQEADPKLALYGTSMYFVNHDADRWDRAPILAVDDVDLRRSLRMSADAVKISAVDLCRAEIQDPKTGASIPFLVWAEQLTGVEQQPLSKLENSGRRLAFRLHVYQAHRMGLSLTVLPATSNPIQEWISVNKLWTARFDSESDPAGVYRTTNEILEMVREAYLTDAVDRFNDRSADFIEYVTANGPELGQYPKPLRIDLELAYNKWTPFRWAWVFTLSTLILIFVSRVAATQFFYVLGVSAFIAGQIALLVGFGMRMAIAGRAPVTNMYESMIFTGLGIGIFGLILELKWRKHFVIAGAAAIVSLVLILADCFPVVLDPAIHPLSPALRSNFWLVVHVMTITLSYSAFALALVIGNITLGHFLIASENWKTIDMLGAINWQCLRIGTLLLAAGTVAGGIWADRSWGRFWGWDPKEVWALITVLGYLAVLHARHVHWVGRFGLAALSVICFSLVVIAWYGVNFVLGSGLHSYGSGYGGEEYVVGLLAIQFVFVAIAAAQSAGHTG